MPAAKRSLTELDTPSFEPQRLTAQVAVSQPARLNALPLPPTAANDNVRAEGLGLADFMPIATDDVSSADDAALPNLQLFAPSDRAMVEDNDTEGLLSDPAGSPVIAEPNLSTRAQTHVAPEAWFDATLQLGATRAAATDPRQLLAWRFRAAFAAYRLLLPTAPTPEARALMMNALRRYERLLRKAAGAPKDEANQVTEALHAQVPEAQAAELDGAMSELEGALLTLDECLPDEQFRSRFNARQVPAKLLLRYARFLASRPFDIGYRRDRFEALAVELLTTKLPSGKWLLMPRKRAGSVLFQLVRGLASPTSSADARSMQLAYLCGALDRLQHIAGAKQFFDSGLYLDIYGYKISIYDSITSPEFLYLCVATQVEIHNRLQSWSQSDAPNSNRPIELPALQIQLRAQHTAAQAVFPNFHRPLGGGNQDARVPSAPKPTPRSNKPRTVGNTSVLRLAGASLLALLSVGAALYASGVIELEKPPEVLSAPRLQDLSPLLLQGRLTQHGTRFEGSVARPIWQRLNQRERLDTAERFAQALKAQGIEHAEVVAYKTPIIQVSFGSVVFVDAPR